jgi:hypothetical protein
VIDSEGEPVANARIELDTGEEAYTDRFGDFSIDALQGIRTVAIYDEDGNKLAEFEVEVEAGKDVNPIDELTVKRHEEEDGPTYWIIILIAAIVLLVILGSLLFFIVRKPSEGEDEDWEDEDYGDDDIDYDEEEVEQYEFEGDWDEE